MNLKTAWKLYTADKSMKDLNSWVNDMVPILMHFTIYAVAVSVLDNKFFKVMAILYLLFVLVAMLTPSE